MILEILHNSNRGYLTEGKYYSNGKTIRLIKEVGYGDITYVVIKVNEEAGLPKTIKVESFEAWAKCPVYVRNF